MRYTYCYLCNKKMNNTWVCSPCVDRYHPTELHNWDDWKHLPSRYSPDDPRVLPEEFEVTMDRDLEMDEGL